MASGGVVNEFMGASDRELSAGTVGVGLGYVDMLEDREVSRFGETAVDSWDVQTPTPWKAGGSLAQSRSLERPGWRPSHGLLVRGIAR